MDTVSHRSENSVSLGPLLSSGTDFSGPDDRLRPAVGSRPCWKGAALAAVAVFVADDLFDGAGTLCYVREITLSSVRDEAYDSWTLMLRPSSRQHVLRFVVNM
jgi:hypothetical protein